MSKSKAKTAKATTKTTSNSDEEDSSMMGNIFKSIKNIKINLEKKCFYYGNVVVFEVYGIKKDGITANQLLEYSRILECRVVKKGKYNNQPLEMTGFTTCKPLQKYVPKLLDEGYTVVVWEEYGEEIVKKRKVRLRKEKGIFSPSTNIDSSNRRISNYCCVVWIEKYDKDAFNKFPYFHCGVALIDNFTGKSKLFEFRYENNNIHNSTAFDELDRIISIYNPSETIFITIMKNNIK